MRPLTVLLATALALLLAGCGTIATAVVVTGTVVGVAVDGALLVGKGVVKGGELVIDALDSDEPAATSDK